MKAARMFGLSSRLGAIGCSLGCKSAGLGILSLALLGGAAPSASAEVIITGTADRVRVEASNATLEELLSALGDKFALSYRSGKLLDERIEGTYSGTLAVVVRRLLTNYDFVIMSDLDSEKSALAVSVLGKSGSPAILNVRTAAGVPTNPPADTPPTPGDILRRQVRALLAPR